jgi:hypothetical protein
MDFLEYQEEIESINRNFYEIIPGNDKQKPYFDIDVDLTLYKNFNEEELIDKLIDSIIEVIGTKVKFDISKDILMFTSHGEKKRSFHIILDNYYFRNCSETKEFCKKVTLICDQSKYIDQLVYTKNRQFRLLGSTKLNDVTRTKRYCTSWKYHGSEIVSPIMTFDELFYHSLIGMTDYCKLLDLFVEVDPHAQSVQNSVDLKLNNQDINKIFECYKIRFNCLNKQLPFKFSEMKDGLILTKRIMPSYCIFCRRWHENENPYFTISSKGMIKYFCRRGNNGFEIGKIESCENVKDNDAVVNEEKEEMVKPLTYQEKKDLINGILDKALMNPNF